MEQCTACKMYASSSFTCRCRSSCKIFIFFLFLPILNGHTVTWLRHYAICRKAMGSSPDVIIFFNKHAGEYTFFYGTEMRIMN
jgi:hypothetical protein